MQTADLSSNYFALFDLPVSFDIDITTLSERYRKLQRVAHPDRFANATESERRFSVQMAARINEGYQALKDPLARGRYLLELNGIELNDLDTAFEGEFLMEQMDFRERLDTAKGSANQAQQCQKIADDIHIKVKELTEEMARLFENNSVDSLEKARELTRKMQFFRRLEEEVDIIEDEIANG